MKLLFDLMASQPSGTAKNHGGAEYCKAIFYKLIENKPKDFLIEVFFNPVKDIDENIIKLCNEHNVKINKCNNIKEISRLLLEGKFDKFYSALPYSFGDLEIPDRTEFIYTVHGIRIIEMPYDKYEIKYRRKSIKNLKLILLGKIYPYYRRKRFKSRINKLFNVTKRKKIITISNHSKYSICNSFPELECDNIEVLYAPPKIINNVRFEDEDKIYSKYGTSSKKYFLIVSSSVWIKNSYRAVIALNKVFTERKELLKDYKVILLGVTNKHMYNKIIDSSNAKKFVFENYVNTDELELLYKNAYALIYPTLNEGFGYPPIEAMKYRTPTLCSAVTSLTEVCGNAALFFNPFNIDEIATRIIEILDKDIRNSLIQKMDNHYESILNKQTEDLNKLINIITSIE